MTCIEALGSNFTELLQLGEDFIILGDLHWNLLNDTAHSGNVLYFCDTLNLTQLVVEPTKITEWTQMLTDLAMTTNINLVDSSISDHNLIEVVLKLKRPRAKPTYIATSDLGGERQHLLRRISNCLSSTHEYFSWHNYENKIIATETTFRAKPFYEIQLRF